MASISEIDSIFCDTFGLVNEWAETGPSFCKQLDYIPLVSTVTGVARMIFGALEMLLGIILLPFQLAKGAVTGENRKYILINGALDILRGYVAIHPIAGNIALYLFDHSILFKSNKSI